MTMEVLPETSVEALARLALMNRKIRRAVEILADARIDHRAYEYLLRELERARQSAARAEVAK